MYALQSNGNSRFLISSVISVSVGLALVYHDYDYLCFIHGDFSFVEAVIHSVYFMLVERMIVVVGVIHGSGARVPQNSYVQGWY